MSASEEAYSRERYGENKWRHSIQKLLIHFTPNQVEWILKSKHMRWAADMSETSRGVPQNAIERYINEGNLDDVEEIPMVKSVVPVEVRGELVPAFETQRLGY